MTSLSVGRVEEDAGRPLTGDQSKSIKCSEARLNNAL